MRKRKTAVAIIVAMLVGVVSAAAQEEGLWTTTPFFYWVETVATDKGPLTVLVNDTEPAGARLQTIIYDGVTHVRLLLELEANHVIIAQGEDVLYEGILFYAPSYNDLIVPEDMPVYVFHTEAGEAPCRRCHRMDPGPADRKPSKPAASICYACHHEEMADRQHLHKPAAVWHCLECHQADFGDSDLYPDAPVRYRVAEITELATLCYRCHEKEQERFGAYEYLHGPVGEGACMFCHDSHGSDQPKLLHDKATTLCVDCHDLGEMLERPVVHPVLLKKGCTACHDPHGSSHGLQLRQAVVELCFSCHPRLREFENSHPVNGHPTHGRPDPRDRQRVMTCASCHDPHGAAAANLLSEEETMLVCIGCHRMGGR